MTQLSYPFPPPGVRVIDLETLRATNYTRGAPGSGSVNFTAIFANRTATAAYAAQYERARASVVQLAACEARLSPTLGGVFIITLATLLYGFWRRTQIRRMFGLPGDTLALLRLLLAVPGVPHAAAGQRGVRAVGGQSRVAAGRRNGVQAAARHRAAGEWSKRGRPAGRRGGWHVSTSWRKDAYARAHFFPRRRPRPG